MWYKAGRSLIKCTYGEYEIQKPIVNIITFLFTDVNLTNSFSQTLIENGKECR